ncbi:MAG: cytochrome c3 family protein [Phycisphaerales bacterium]
MESNLYRSAACRKLARVSTVGVCVLFAGASLIASALVGPRAAAAEGPSPDFISKDTGHCNACHKMDAAFSHPVDVVPPFAVPGVLPLKDGRLTCETCHDGRLAAGHSEGGRSGRKFLRVPDEMGALCSSCHAGGVVPHGMSQLRAHLATSDVAGRASGVDEESRTCLRCHDGAMASDAGGHQGDPLLGELPSDHPIGVAMDQRLGVGGEFRMRSVQSLDRRVRLFGRTVGCGSCHSVYSGQENLLVMSNRGSALCLTCHVQ